MNPIWKVLSYHFLYEWTALPQGLSWEKTAALPHDKLCQFVQVAPLPYTLQQNTGTWWCCGCCSRMGSSKMRSWLLGETIFSHGLRFHQPNSGDEWGQYMESWWKFMGFHGDITTHFQGLNIKLLKFTGFRCGVRRQTWWFNQNDDVTLNSINTWGFISKGFPLWKNCSWR